MTKTASTAARRSPGPGSRRPRGRAAPQKETQDRILDAAERLFAERGIDAVSVRSVLAAAGVNVSLAHYHFGGRDGLIEALLRRRLGPIAEERARRLAEVEARGNATLEHVLRAYHEHPSPEWLEAHPDFCRLIGQLQFSPNPRIRKIVRDVLRDATAPFGAALVSRAPPGLDPARLICRFYFVLGVGAVAAMSRSDIANSVAKRVGPDAALDERTIVDEIVRFCAAGLRGVEEGKP